MLRFLRLLFIVSMATSLALADPGDPNGGGGGGGNSGGGNNGGNGNATGNPGNGNNGNGSDRGNAGGNGNGTGNPGNGNNGNSGSVGNAGGGGAGAPGTSRIASLGRHRQTRSHNGEYDIIIAGTVRGTGLARVSDNSVSFIVNVTTPDGTAGSFTASGLAIEGPYFDGQAVLLGQVVTVHGRLDAPKSSRLVATFRGEGAQIGRVVGTLPGDQIDDRWNAD